ncbi:hypothetical protein [Verrucomicrobium sp. BvORR106]|uniref:hypothetical protein n=1 Tax=Verrucomicrobium sp. BvORR106 TaxID=1403819 RepID=UPI0006909830|nr:hypothetical protein [Verrucomicrobium sp. BvORR106]
MSGRLLLLVVWLAAASASAHRLDEYLQATLVVIEPSAVRLQLTLTPGVEVANDVLAQIDRDGNGAISEKEAANYAEALLQNLVARLDGQNLELKLTHSKFPAPPGLRSGTASIELDYSTPIEPLAAGVHKLSLENQHLAGVSVYLLNAALPKSEKIKIKRQLRSEYQRTGEIEFEVSP